MVSDAAGRPKARLLIETDVTEKKRLEAQYLRAQRMESIGTLAGGIAHDLNNVLTPITVYIDNVRVVPEPATGALFGLGAVALGLVARRRVA